LCVFTVVIFCGFNLSASAQSCSFGGDKAFEATRKLLFNAATCAAASHILEKCMWGSSADNEFSFIVVKKCEASFREKLTATQENRYKEKMRLCDDKYASMQGTISISEAALCRASVAEDFASDPVKASAPAPRASFDCRRAASPLEHAICSNRELGIADLNLSEAYKDTIRAASSKQRLVLIRNQKDWLKTLTDRCQISPKSEHSQKIIECLQTEFRNRFQFLDSCSMGGPQECIEEIKNR
jgi:uncharacterized protein YecT (DUF1311 family)